MNLFLAYHELGEPADVNASVVFVELHNSLQLEIVLVTENFNVLFILAIKYKPAPSLLTSVFN